MTKTVAPRNHVHYDLTTGELISRGNSAPPMEKTGCGIIYVGESFPDFDRQKVDLASSAIIEKTDEEIRAALEPRSADVAMVVAAELAGTDQYMMVDRPLSDEMRGAWAGYRQALRDLSKLSTALDQIDAWPLRPDGRDAAALLKLRAAKRNHQNG